MKSMLRTLHKWVGLILAIQFFLWLGSGLAMALFDHHAVSGQHYRAAAPAARLWPHTGVIAPASLLAGQGKPVETIETAWLLNRPVYKLIGQDKRWLLDAQTGQPVQVGSADALAVARADYTGPGQALVPVLMAEPGLEARRHKGAVWRVDFRDVDGTTLYVSAEDGRVLERRNDLWRWFDIAWMLHIMDYSKREDFNHPLLVLCSIGGVWMAISGIWLLCMSIRIKSPLRRWPQKAMEKT